MEHLASTVETLPHLDLKFIMIALYQQYYH